MTNQLANLAKHGIYRPEFESGACGVGIVAATEGTPLREVLPNTKVGE